MKHDEILNLGYRKVRTLSNGVAAALYPILLFGCGRVCFCIQDYGYEYHFDFESFAEAEQQFNELDPETDKTLIRKFNLVSRNFGEE